MDYVRCRACGGAAGDIVLDLGDQPASDNFPKRDDPGPDPVYPLQMWLCAGCGLAQLAMDPTVPEEPRATEPQALTDQAADAVGRVAASGWLAASGRAIEFASPHGGSWMPHLIRRGLSRAEPFESAELVLDCFGMMHCPDQKRALEERASLVRSEGVLLLQYHSFATILRYGQWNALRHGHYAYYSTTALQSMLARVGFTASAAWKFDLYGGTVLLAATRADKSDDRDIDGTVRALIADEEELRVTDPMSVRSIQQVAEAKAAALRKWLMAKRAEGVTVMGYGAASRAVALLSRAGIGRSLLPAIVDASPAKQGRRMPGTDIPVVGSDELVNVGPVSVALFLPDLLAEVRSNLPQVEGAGGEWVDVEHL